MDAELQINDIEDCQRCGNCCNTPCDLIPSDLPPLLNRFDMQLPDFFKEYLISLIITSPQFDDWILMMVPVRVDANLKRSPKYLADNEYINMKRNCIFFDKSNCKINDIKPHGGRLLTCGKMTGSVSIYIIKQFAYAYWKQNQHLFDLIFPGYLEIYKKLQTIVEKKNEIYQRFKRYTDEYKNLSMQQRDIFETRIFPLFNNAPPTNGFMPLPGINGLILENLLKLLYGEASDTALERLIRCIESEE